MKPARTLDTSTTIKRYDQSSRVYDWTFDFPYHRARAWAFSRLTLEPHDHIIDAGCGTGVNFAHYMRTATAGRVYAIDASVGMLRKAVAKIRANQWRRIVPVLKRLEHLEARDIGEPVVPCKVFFSLCLTAIPNWTVAFERVYRLVPAGSTIVIMDIHRRPESIRGRILDYIAASDTSRDVSALLRHYGAGYRERIFDSFRFFGVDIRASAAIKA